MSEPRGACPIGPLNLHTMNYERTECIWCGPGRLASMPGRWVPIGDGSDAWSATPPLPLPPRTTKGERP